MAPRYCTNVVKKAGLVRKNATKLGKKKRRKGSYVVYKLIKQINPVIRISSEAESMMNSFVEDILENIAAESSRLANYSNRSNITAQEVQAALNLLLFLDLVTEASVSDGTQAVSN